MLPAMHVQCSKVGGLLCCRAEPARVGIQQTWRFPGSTATRRCSAQLCRPSGPARPQEGCSAGLKAARSPAGEPACESDCFKLQRGECLPPISVNRCKRCAPDHISMCHLALLPPVCRRRRWRHRALARNPQCAGQAMLRAKAGRGWGRTPFSQPHLMMSSARCWAAVIACLG